ncbi:uncharacterized protein LOC136083215 [Hydra vulgaris]|uniref:Uncharacterized protein LOC136083215 n=1 Tax=Hydra vulgaris TaxID=6087 RepID=A0ABM4CAL3_HYDVU
MLDAIIFLSERGLALFGSNQRIGDRANGNFLGIIELLSKYDPLLAEHVKHVRESQHSSPQRWEILKQHFPVSLHGMSKTRWSARIDGVKPVAQHLKSVRSALNELGVPHLTAQAKMELNAIQKYISKFDCILMSSIWMKLLTMIHETNLIIEARQATLDIEKDNIENLCNDIQRLREQFDKILNESKFVARNIDVLCEFLTNRHFPSQDDAELYFKISQ